MLYYFSDLAHSFMAAADRIMSSVLCCVYVWYIVVVGSMLYATWVSHSLAAMLCSQFLRRCAGESTFRPSPHLFCVCPARMPDFCAQKAASDMRKVAQKRVARCAASRS